MYAKSLWTDDVSLTKGRCRERRKNVPHTEGIQKQHGVGREL